MNRQKPLVVVNPVYQGPKYAHYTNNIAGKITEILGSGSSIRAVHMLNLCKDYHGKMPGGKPYPAIVKYNSIRRLDNREGVGFVLNINVRKRDSPGNRGMQVEYGSLQNEAKLLAASAQAAFDKNPAIIFGGKVYETTEFGGKKNGASVYNVVGTRVAHGEQLVLRQPLSSMAKDIQPILEAQRNEKFITQMQFQRAMNAIAQLVGEYREGRHNERLSVLVTGILEREIEAENGRPLGVKAQIREIARMYGNSSTLFVKNHHGYLKSVSYVVGNPNSQFDRLVMDSPHGISVHSQAAADFLCTVTCRN